MELAGIGDFLVEAVDDLDQVGCEFLLLPLPPLLGSDPVLLYHRAGVLPTRFAVRAPAAIAAALASQRDPRCSSFSITSGKKASRIS
eukprot:14205503-Heterocapsa_arctica.AAC.1